MPAAGLLYEQTQQLSGTVSVLPGLSHTWEPADSTWTLNGGGAAVTPNGSFLVTNTKCQIIAKLKAGSSATGSGSLKIGPDGSGGSLTTSTLSPWNLTTSYSPQSLNYAHTGWPPTAGDAPSGKNVYGYAHWTNSSAVTASVTYDISATLQFDGYWMATGLML